MKFITAKKNSGCIFCDKPKENRDRENYILYRGKTCFIILNAFPYNNGHLMIVPYQHTADLSALSPETLAEMMLLVQHSVATISSFMHPDGYNIGMNLGKCAGAGIADHLHMHVVPRWDGDTNFMPVLGETRLIPEMLEHTYDRLIQAGIGRPPAPELVGAPGAGQA